MKKQAKKSPVVMGGAVIAAGARATVDLPLTNLSNHTPICMPVHVVNGQLDGPVLFVAAGLHGDEINGVEIIRRLLNVSALKRIRGTLVAVPIVNVLGFLARSRYLPDRRDLNRSFPGTQGGSMAGRLASLFLSEIVAKATHGIDLHTAAIHRENYPQIRVNLDDQIAADMALAFGVPIVINAGFRDGSLRQSARHYNVPVLVYEAGEALRFDEACIRAGVNGILQVMRHIGLLTQTQRTKAHTTLVLRSSRWVRAPRSGVLRINARLGSFVEIGQSLAFVADPFGENEVEITAPTSGIVIGRTNMPLVYEGEALFNIAHTDGTQVVATALDEFDPIEAYEVGVTAELAEEPRIV